MTDGQTEARESLEHVDGPGHSIARHPLACDPDFAAIRDDVQFCRISWPVGAEIHGDKDSSCRVTFDFDDLWARSIEDLQRRGFELREIKLVQPSTMHEVVMLIPSKHFSAHNNGK